MKIKDFKEIKHNMDINDIEDIQDIYVKRTVGTTRTSWESKTTKKKNN